MGRLFTAASSMSLEAAFSAVTAEPLTMSFWGRTADVTAIQSGVMIQDGAQTNDDFFKLYTHSTPEPRFAAREAGA